MQALEIVLFCLRRSGVTERRQSVPLAAGVFDNMVLSRLAASQSFTKGIHLHACPAGAYFCMCKSRQNTLGAVPQGPLTLKLRLDTNDARASSVQRRRYALKVPAAHFVLSSAETELNAPAAPYKRRLAPDPGGRRPSGRGVPMRWGSRGPPRVTFAYFSSQKSRATAASRTGCHLLVTPRRR